VNEGFPLILTVQLSSFWGKQKLLFDSRMTEYGSSEF